MNAPLYPQTLALSAPARLHLGFLDMGNHLGRRFGSVGLALERPGLKIRGALTKTRHVEGEETARINTLLNLLESEFDLKEPVHIIVDERIPPHSGLGSGTQLALALGTLVSALHGQSISPRELARHLDRGNRSGIGIGAFEGGGFLLDGGRGMTNDVPPLLTRLPFPEDWRLLLLFDAKHRGLHGEAEIEAFKALPVFPQALAAHLCHLTLMKMLPALVEHDFVPFAEAVTELQNTVGDHFAPAQGGRYTSPSVDQALQKLSQAGAVGLGQSSWGPTGFVLCPDEDSARRWQTMVQALMLSNLSSDIVKVDTQGMTWVPSPQPISI